ncbi:NAD(P)-dependent oxidoreductase [Chitinophaga sp. RAB17]|uniref:NAD(P)-dependent oxidoreductase n=1 Tax=Chitinophaga sp. RAB17 TaxID=3233049 RepID=UPI003F910829
METTQKHILLFGITGGTGSIIAENLIRKGYHVTAIARDPVKVNFQHPNLLIRKGDITQPGTFADLVQQHDIIISAVGSRSRMPTTLYSDGMKHILHAMDKPERKRLICISALPIEINSVMTVWQRWLIKYIVRKIFRHPYKDLLIMEKLLRNTQVNWTIVRPPWLKDSAPAGHYKVAINTHLKRPFSISRADLAAYITDIIDNPETNRSIIEIAY